MILANCRTPMDTVDAKMTLTSCNSTKGACLPSSDVNFWVWVCSVSLMWCKSTCYKSYSKRAWMSSVEWCQRFSGWVHMYYFTDWLNSTLANCGDTDVLLSSFWQTVQFVAKEQMFAMWSVICTWLWF